MTIAATVLATFLGALGLVAVRSSQAYEEGSQAAALDARMYRGLESIVRELEDVGRSQIDPQPLAPNGAEALDFRVADDFVDGAITWSGVRRIAWEIEASEVDDGIDNDGDVLVDEGCVVFVDQPGTLDERRVVLLRGVREFDDGETANGLDDDDDGLQDERGLAFLLQGDVLRIQLCVEGTDSRGVVRARSAATSIHVRNDGGL